MTQGLSEKIALVTGAAQGIGAAVVRALAEAGATIVATDMQDVSDTLSGVPNARGINCDVSDADSVDALFRSISETEGGLDFAINAAGILFEARLIDMDPSEFDRMISVNLRGSFLIAQGAARLMTQVNSGRIILIASELAYLGRADYSAYCASKAGVVGLTRSLARELAPAITVNTVAPGPVDTQMLAVENMSPEWIEKELDVPLGRIAQPAEIGGLVRFLCGPDAGYFTGQTLSPNGGAVMI
ncbi:3-oxoacyl-[acyl-carrier protein] reductase [Ruegeria halocynthiae]|uniref:3-oxoacyl-[acyl-carrier protein] reductase n=1 Tax=Ruegeria halocynthiae TaxID=985054 RepID=A0A1H3EJ05_9RHOB|nr:SDR family oxidoreductase [Ruegeria halocynthiae]SDX78763.1 3-oxoacyl-[acyl-carrier protein] reductase [Ruegeria halocynthiae]